MPRTEIEPCKAYLIDAQPGNGTRYRLAVVVDEENGFVHSVSWADLAWSAGDFRLPVSGEWLASRSERVNLADGKAIAELLNDRPWEEVW